jgi:LAO/AO transport system ATPase
LARLLSLAARGEHLHAISAGIPQPAQPARVVAFTGSGGVGKSSLVGKMIEHVRGLGHSVGVLACDPQSPLSGGALLGDRFRMPSRPADDGVFIRSLAALSGHGAIADHLPVLVKLLEGFGFDVVLIETVGAGQGDTTVHELADVVVLLLQPETGDDLQWEKAGVLEVADVVVIHKADLPGADQALAQVRATLDLSGGRPIPVLRASAKTGEGIEELWRLISNFPTRVVNAGNDRQLIILTQQLIASRFAQAQKDGDEEVRCLLRQWREGKLPEAEAAALLLAALARKPHVLVRNS